MTDMNNHSKKSTARSSSGILLSPLIVIGAILILLPIFVFMILQNINRQESFGTQLLLEKGAALIRAFEAGTRAGMMGPGWGTRHLQELLVETAQQPDIAYLLLIDNKGRVIAHNDTGRIGTVHQPTIDTQEISKSQEPQWRSVETEEGEKIFEVYKVYRPSRRMGRMGHRNRMHRQDGEIFEQMQGRMQKFFQRFGLPVPGFSDRKRLAPTIILGFNTLTLETARADDRNRAIITGLILFLVSAFGIVLLFLFYNYRVAQSSLFRIKAFSDSLLDNMPIGLLAFDGGFRITSINAFAESLLNLDPDQAIQGHAGSVLPPSLWKQIENHTSQGGSVDKEIACRLASGRILPLEIEISQFKGEKADSIGYILLFKDLSQVKALQKEIIRSQRLASIGRLAAGVAHEIRNPLSSIKGFATYFKERYPDVPQDQKIARIMIDEVERLNRVVGQLLELAKPVDIVPTPTDLMTLIDDSIGLVEQSALDKQISISRPRQIEGMFLLDSDKIRQVLLNLYLNAVDAMPDGGKLDISVTRVAEENRLEIGVTDTGHGIQPENIANIYDPYYTTKQTGTGLGLAVVHNIVEAHGGTLTVESQPGTGSTFTLSIPDSSGVIHDES